MRLGRWNGNSWREGSGRQRSEQTSTLIGCSSGAAFSLQRVQNVSKTSADDHWRAGRWGRPSRPIAFVHSEHPLMFGERPRASQPAMAIGFVRRRLKWGSLDRCTGIAKAHGRHRLRLLQCLTLALLIQCVLPLVGRVCSVVLINSATRRSSMLRGLPGRNSSCSPAGRCSTKRLRRFHTVLTSISSLLVDLPRMVPPAAHSSTMRARMPNPGRQ